MNISSTRAFLFFIMAEKKKYLYLLQTGWCAISTTGLKRQPGTGNPIRKELKEILKIQFSDNVKARWLDNNLRINIKEINRKKYGPRLKFISI